ncbi:MAG: hypothetical protein ACRCUY_11145 [Thermoguttaceae bacterium]
MSDEYLFHSGISSVKGHSLAGDYSKEFAESFVAIQNIDPTLAEVVQSWHRLSHIQKVDILAILRNAVPKLANE